VISGRSCIMWPICFFPQGFMLLFSQNISCFHLSQSHTTKDYHFLFLDILFDHSSYSKFVGKYCLFCYNLYYYYRYFNYDLFINNIYIKLNKMSL
jgi:hypothetical protein